jgi:hypothetical protein
MFAKLRCGAGGASADAGHWLQLHSTVRLCLFGTSLSNVAQHHVTKAPSRRAVRSPSHRTLSIGPFRRGHRSLHQPLLSIKPRAVLSFASLSASRTYRLPSPTAGAVAGHEPSHRSHQPSIVHRPLSISRRSHLPGQPSVISRRRGARRPRSHRGPRSPPNATIAALHRAHSRP